MASTASPTAQYACASCHTSFRHKPNLYRHYQLNPSHKPVRQEATVTKSAEAVQHFLLGLSDYHRRARVREFLRALTPTEITEIVMPVVCGHVSSYQYLLTKSKTKYTMEDTSRLRRAVQKEYDALTAEMSLSFKDIAVNTKSSTATSSAQGLSHLIDDLHADSQEDLLSKLITCHQTVAADTILKTNNANICREVFMPKFQDFYQEELVKMNVGLLVSLSIGQRQYQDIVRNHWGKKLSEATGLNPFLPLKTVLKELNNTKEILRQEVGLNFVRCERFVAAYTDICKHIQFLLKQPGVQHALHFPKDVLLIYDYMDEYAFMGWSQLYTGETSIQLKIVEPYNLQSLILKVGK